MSKALATKNVAAVLLALTMAFSFAFAFATPAKADQTSDLQAQVQALLAQIQALQGNTSNASCVNFTFTTNLSSGKSSAEVMQIQKFLNQWADTRVSASGAGSVGNETSYFGPATKAAVIKFQNKYAADILTPVGLSAGNGNWYSSTRAKANSITATCVPGSTGGNTGGNTGGTTGGNLVVAASTQPANSLAPQGASRVPFTTFTLTNTSGSAVTVNGVTVQRTGLAQDAVFAGIVLVDSNGAQIGTSRTLDSNHMATIGDTFTIGAGQSMTFTVAGNMNSSLSSYAGQVVGIAVTGINTTSTVSGSLPISGAMQTINATLSIGTATLAMSSFDPNSAQTKNIGDTAVKFSGVRFTAGSAEDIKLFSIRFRLNGSASPSDISNTVVMVNGVSYPTSLSTDGRYYTAVIPGGLLITKGNSVDAYIQSDITGSNAAGRTIEFDIDRTSDVYIVGQTYGYGITPTLSTTGSFSTASTHGTAITTTNQPFFQGSTVTVSGASITTIARATEVPAQNVAVNVPGQVLGGFVADIKGEALRVSTMTFNISGVATSTTNQLTNITLVNDAGAVIAGPVDAVGNVVTFNNSITLQTGRHIYTLKGTIPTASANGGTYTLNTTPSSWSGVTGNNTGNNVTISNGNFTMNTVTVRGAALNITAATTPAAQTIVAGGQNVLLANIQLDASQSGEDIRMNAIPLQFTAAPSSAQLSSLTSCQLFNGATAISSGSNIVNPSATSTTITFDSSLVIPKATVVTLSVKCNLASNASGSFTVGVSSGSTYSATGVQSGSTVTVTSSTTNSGTQTVGSSSLTVSTDASSPSFALVAGGSTGTTVGALKFRATGEDMSLTELGLTGSSAIASDVVSARIYNGATQVGTVTFTSSGTTATSTLSTPVTLAKDTDVVLTIKVDVANVGTSQSGTAGDVVTINYSGAKATGMNSGSTVYATGSSSVAGVRLERSYPSLALQTLPSTGVADGRLMRFSVTANAGGNVGLQKFTFQVATSTASASSLILYAYTDSGYSTPVSSASSGQLNSSAASATSTSNVVIYTNNVTNGVLQVPAGQTYYFELRGTVTGVATGASVSTTLLGDTSGTNVGATSTLTGQNFVWSPNSTTTTSVSGGSNDFRNGYGVPGLPASGLTQTRNQ